MELTGNRKKKKSEDSRGDIYIYIASQVALVVKNLPANAGYARHMGSIPGSGRSLGRGNRNPLQYFCLENSMDGGAWRTIVHGVTKSQTPLSTHIHAVEVMEFQLNYLKS